MPKVNIYLSDRLAEAVRAYQVPLSSVCQQALEREVAARMSVLALTPRSRQVLALSAQEAEKLGHNYVGTEHLLLGLVVEGEGVAAQVLGELGVAEAVRRRLVEIMTSSPYAGEPSNQCVDKHGNLIGYMLQDEEGNPFVVGRNGRAIHIRRDGEGNVTVVDDTGNAVPLEPAERFPRLVRTNDEGNLVAVVDSRGQRELDEEG